MLGHSWSGRQIGGTSTSRKRSATCRGQQDIEVPGIKRMDEVSATDLSVREPTDACDDQLGSGPGRLVRSPMARCLSPRRHGKEMRPELAGQIVTQFPDTTTLNVGADQGASESEDPLQAS